MDQYGFQRYATGIENPSFSFDKGEISPTHCYDQNVYAVSKWLYCITGCAKIKKKFSLQMFHIFLVLVQLQLAYRRN